MILEKGSIMMNPFEYEEMMHKAFFDTSPMGSEKPQSQMTGKEQLEAMLAKGIGGPKEGIQGLNVPRGELSPGAPSEE